MYSFNNLVVLLTSPLKCGYPLFILILFLITKTKYKDKFDVKHTLVIANILLLISSTIAFLFYIYQLFLLKYGNIPEYTVFISRTKSSSGAYLLPVIVPAFLPFLFLLKKLRESVLCSVIVAFFITLFLNIDNIMIFIISLHRDYLPSKWIYYHFLPEKIFLNPIIQTILLSLIVLIIYRIKKK